MTNDFGRRPATDEVSADVVRTRNVEKRLVLLAEAECPAKYLAERRLRQVVNDCMRIEDEDQVVMICKQIEIVLCGE